MKLLVIMLLVALPSTAKDASPVQKGSLVPVDIGVNNFEEDVESASSKIRRLIWESRRERCVRSIYKAIARRDPEAAQKALDTLVREYPELKSQEPHAIELHQGTINFWRGDFNGAYKEFNQGVKALEREFPKGVPRGEKYSEINASFMADMYFCRGAVELHQGDYAKAVLDIDKAISVSPKPKAHMQVNKCRALLQLNKYKEASEAYDLAYKINSQWAMDAEDRKWICATLGKSGFQPQPCL